MERCTHCGEETPLDREGPLAEEGEEVPLCSCGGHLRPGVVWFSEGLPAETLGAAGRLIRRAGALIVVGTSGVVEPAASLVRLAPPGMLLVEEAGGKCADRIGQPLRIDSRSVIVSNGRVQDLIQDAVLWRD